MDVGQRYNQRFIPFDRRIRHRWKVDKCLRTAAGNDNCSRQRRAWLQIIRISLARREGDRIIDPDIANSRFIKTNSKSQVTTFLGGGIRDADNRRAVIVDDDPRGHPIGNLG